MNDKHSILLDEDSDDRYTGTATSANHLRAEKRMFWPTGDLREDASRLEQLAHDLRAIHAGKLKLDPDACVKLSNWRLSYRRVISLSGVTLGHPRLGNKPIHTSEVYFIDLELGIARTLSRWYRLTTSPDASASTSQH
jgi:hypothetical protein